MFMHQRPIQSKCHSLDSCYRALLGKQSFPALIALSGCKNNAVTDPPTLHGLGKLYRSSLFLRRCPELDPCSAHGSAMKVHAPATANNGRTRLLVHAFHVNEPDE